MAAVLRAFDVMSCVRVRGCCSTQKPTDLVGNLKSEHVESRHDPPFSVCSARFGSVWAFESQTPELIVPLSVSKPDLIRDASFRASALTRT